MQVAAAAELQLLVPTLYTEPWLALAISPLQCNYLVFLLFQDPMPVDACKFYDFLHIHLCSHFEVRDRRLTTPNSSVQKMESNHCKKPMF